MAATLIGVVYDAATKEVLRIIVPDSDVQLQVTQWVGPGENFLTLTGIDLPTDPVEYNAFVAQAVIAASTAISSAS